MRNWSGQIKYCLKSTLQRYEEQKNFVWEKRLPRFSHTKPKISSVRQKTKNPFIYRRYANHFNVF